MSHGGSNVPWACTQTAMKMGSISMQSCLRIPNSTPQSHSTLRGTWISVKQNTVGIHHRLLMHLKPPKSQFPCLSKYLIPASYSPMGSKYTSACNAPGRGSNFMDQPLLHLP